MTSATAPAAPASADVTTAQTITPPAPLPFKGSILILDQSITPDTIAPGAQLSAVPSYQWWISFRPRWQLTKSLQFRGRADLTMEWLNAAETTHYHEVQWGDIWTDLVYTGIPTFGGIQANFGIRALWPLSLESQSQGTYVTLGAMTSLDRTFEHTPIGAFDITVGLAGTHPFTSSTTAGVVDGGYECQTVEQAPALCLSNTGAELTAFQLVSSLSLKWSPIEQLNFSATYLVIDKWAYNTPDVTVSDPSGGSYTVPRSSGDQRLRQGGWFIASVDADVVKWLNLSLGYYVYRPILDPNGQYGDPFYSPGGNTRIFFTTTIAIDNLYDSVSGLVHKHPTNVAKN